MAKKEDKKYSLEELKALQGIFQGGDEQKTGAFPQQGVQQPLTDPTAPIYEDNVIPGTDMPRPVADPIISEQSKNELSKQSEEFNQKPVTQPVTSDQETPEAGAPSMGSETKSEPTEKPIKKATERPRQVNLLGKNRKIEKGYKRALGEKADATTDVLEEHEHQHQQLMGRIDQSIEFHSQNAKRNLDNIDLAVSELRAHKIDENRYFGNMSTPRKILASIALFFSGVGESSEVLDFIENQIRIDLEGQKAEKAALAENVKNLQTIYQLAISEGQSELNALTMMSKAQLEYVTKQLHSIQANFESKDPVQQQKLLEFEAGLAEREAKINQIYMKTYTDENVKKDTKKAIDELKRKKQQQELLNKQQTFEQKATEVSLYVGDSKDGKPNVFTTKDKKSRAKADENVKGYIKAYNLGKKLQASFKRILSKGTKEMSKADFVKFLKRGDLAGKMIERINQTGGGNVSTYEHYILSVFEDLGFLKSRKTDIGQKWEYVTSPIGQWDETNIKNALGMVEERLKANDDLIRSDLTGHISPSEIKRFQETFNKDELLKSYGVPKDYQVDRGPDGKLIINRIMYP